MGVGPTLSTPQKLATRCESEVDFAHIEPNVEADGREFGSEGAVTGCGNVVKPLLQVTELPELPPEGMQSFVWEGDLALVEHLAQAK